MAVRGIRYKDFDEPWSDRGVLDVDIEAIWKTSAEYQDRFLYPWKYSNRHRKLQLALGGRGTGKTWMMVRKSLLSGLDNPGCISLLCGRTGRELRDKIQYEMELAIRQFLDATGVLLATFSKAEQAYDLLNGHRILCRPYGQPATARKLAGYTASAVFIDEEARAQIDGTYAFDIIYPALREKRAAGKQLYCVVTSPDGLKGFVEQVYTLQEKEDKARAKLADAKLRGLADEVIAELEREVDAASETYTVRGSIEDAGHLSAGFVQSMRATMSKSAWEQEGKGRILAPKGLIYHAFDIERHIVGAPNCPLKDWSWTRGNPYVLMNDPGPNHAYACIAQVDDRGRWVLCWELKMEGAELQQARFRQRIWDKTEAIYKATGQRPYMVACDRADTETGHRNWLIHTYGPLCQGRVLAPQSGAEKSVGRGLSLVESLLDPADGSEPKVYLWAPGGGLGISRSVKSQNRGMYGSLLNYRWMTNKDGGLTKDPLKDDINDHAPDALRYGLVMSRRMRELHGGQPLDFDEFAGSVYQDPDDSDAGFVFPAGK